MFILTSTDITDGATASPSMLYDKAGCTGDNRSPQLSWTDPPKGSESFAVTLHDPDAPRPGGWWHWTVFDLPATTRGLPSNAGDARGLLLPANAIQCVNDYGETGYGGPCPPKDHGAHRYVLTVHALSVAYLGFNHKDTPAAVTHVIERFSLASSSLTFLYGR